MDGLIGMSHSSRPVTYIPPIRRLMFIMGYIPSHNRVYLADKDVNIYRYSLLPNAQYRGVPDSGSSW